MSQMTPEQKREFIISTIMWFGIDECNIKILEKAFKEDINPTISTYLDRYLIPLIPTLFRDKRKDGLWPNREGVRFKGLMQLCFEGHLSQNAWDAIWELLPEEEKMYYATTIDHGTYPLVLAVSTGNLEGVMRLDRIYSQLLSKHPTRLSTVHWGLRKALLDIPKLIDLEQEQNQKLFNYLLQMCNKFSIPMESYSPTDRLNKLFNYFIKDSYADETQTTSLFEVFSELCVDYCSYKNSLVAKQLSNFLNKNLGELAFAQFKDHVLSLLDKKHPKNSLAHQNCLDALVYQDGLMEQYTVPETIIDTDKGSNASTKRTLLITGIFTAIGLAVGAAVGVTLVMTGVFAPVGLGILGATCTGIGVALGFVGLGFGVTQWTQDDCDEEIISGENNGSVKKMGGLGGSVESNLSNSQPVLNHGALYTPIASNPVFERESNYSNII